MECAVQFVKGDIQSADLVRHIFDQEEIDTVMHFAAQVGMQAVAYQTFRLSLLSMYLCNLSSACRLM